MENSCIIVSILCIASSVLFTSCDSLQLASSAHIDLASDHDHQHTHPAVLPVPRKLKLREHHLASVKKDSNGGDQDLAIPNAKKDAFLAGEAHDKEAKRMHSPIRTWREWVEAEGSDTSQYFTMDYSHVRRRRPIHNKSLPVAP